MSIDGFVGLDPDAAREIGRVAARAGETAGHIASEVARVLLAAQIADNGFAVLCGEVGEELGLLERFLEAKATEMELAASGMCLDVAGPAGPALWASLTDEVGEGVDFADEPGVEDVTVTMSSSVAAAMLAEYLAWRGEDAWVDLSGLRELVDDEAVPPEVRAAAQYVVLHGELWSEVAWTPLGAATAEDFDRFVVTNGSLAVLARSIDRFDVAGQDAGSDPDGEVSTKDMEIVAGDTTGRFSAAEREAARWLLEEAGIASVWNSRQDLTYRLYTRRNFSEDPALAVEYLRRAVDDPGGFVADYTWYEAGGGRDWLEAALAATADPQDQARILLDFAALYQATMPEPVGLLQIVHDLLDGVSFVDPFQVADTVNTGIYIVEGDRLSAAISAAGILIPIGGRKVLELAEEALLGFAAHESDEVAALVFRESFRAGELTDDVVEDVVLKVGDQFGDDIARAVRTHIDELRAVPIRTNGVIDIASMEGRRATEIATAGRLIEHPELAGRTLYSYADEGADYIDDLGRRFDAMGTPAASRHWNEGQFLNAINDHLLKSNHFTVIDLTEFTPQQIAIVERYVDSLGPASQAKIIRIGF